MKRSLKVKTSKNSNIAGNDIIIINDNAELIKLIHKVLKELKQLKRKRK